MVQDAPRERLSVDNSQQYHKYSYLHQQMESNTLQKNLFPYSKNKKPKTRSILINDAVATNLVPIKWCSLYKLPKQPAQKKESKINGDLLNMDVCYMINIWMNLIC